MNVNSVSREYGAGGGEAARRLSETLGWELLDRELLHRAAVAALVRGGYSAGDRVRPSRRVLTLARELGAGEQRFAPALAERLQMQVYDRELLLTPVLKMILVQGFSPLFPGLPLVGLAHWLRRAQ